VEPFDISGRTRLREALAMRTLLFGAEQGFPPGVELDDRAPPSRLFLRGENADRPASVLFFTLAYCRSPKPRGAGTVPANGGRGTAKILGEG
jgi:hypothetical protein